MRMGVVDLLMKFIKLNNPFFFWRVTGKLRKGVAGDDVLL